MQRSHSYTYPQTAMVGHSRYASTHATSSAFSASANPNEDWTKISDLAERRRIQNRIAQRNYRKKLKRRLEDLERRAGSSSTSPEQSHSELVTSTPAKESKQPQSMARQNSRSSTQDAQRASPEILPLDDHSSIFDTPAARHLSMNSPPAFTFSSYPPTTSYLQYEHQQQSVYDSTPSYYSSYQYPVDVTSSSLPPTLPAMLPSAYGKQDHLFADDDVLNPFSMNYASLAGLEMPSNHAYTGASSHTPPLTDPYSLDSAHNSPNYFDVPLTPVSRTASPNIQWFDIGCM